MILRRRLLNLLPILLVSLLAAPAQGVSPGPPEVPSLFVPIDADVSRPGSIRVADLTSEWRSRGHATPCHGTARHHPGPGTVRSPEDRSRVRPPEERG